MPRLNASHILIRSGFILACLISGAVQTSAQTGSVKGKVTDSVGNAVVGVEIKAVSSSPDRNLTPQTFKAISNLEGEFTIPDLPFGFYEIEVKAPGFTTRKEKVVVDGHQPSRLDVEIPIPKVCGDAKGPNISLAEKDKAEIINQVL